jgi:hypothetical protein
MAEHQVGAPLLVVLAVELTVMTLVQQVYQAE